MPRYDLYLQQQYHNANGLVGAGETSRAVGGVTGRTNWSTSRIELLHELTYLRLFCAWENVLEYILYRSLCGYASRAGQETLHRPTYFPCLADAERDVHQGNQFLLWHKPAKVIERCQRYIRSGAPGCHAIQESVIRSKLTHLEGLSSIRHRIAHDQKDANKFDNVTLAMAGRTYQASRPGKFLRDREPATGKKWLQVIAEDLVSLANQMV